MQRLFLAAVEMNTLGIIINESVSSVISTDNAIKPKSNIISILIYIACLVNNE